MRHLQPVCVLLGALAPHRLPTTTIIIIIIATHPTLSQGRMHASIDAPCTQCLRHGDLITTIGSPWWVNATSSPRQPS
jgi:hypothetical protein